MNPLPTLHTLALAVLIATSATPALSAPTVAWKCGDGNWSTTACWSTAALPGGADDAVINTPAGSWATVQYSLVSATIANLALQTALNSNGNMPTVRQRSGSLTVTGTTTVGATGPAGYMLDDGSLTTKTLFVGGSLGANSGEGKFSLLGGTLRSGVDNGGFLDGGTVIGRDGRGSFMHGGGTHRTTYLTLGSVSYNVPGYTSDAYYTLNAGALQIDHSAYIGGRGAGNAEFQMGDGTVNIRFALNVGPAPGASARWSQTGGTTTAAFTTVGGDGSGGGGSLGLSGTAVLNTNILTVGSAGLPYWGATGLAPAFDTSYLSLSGWSSAQQASLNATKGSVGGFSKAVVEQSQHSNATYSEHLWLGSSVLGHGTYYLSGGTLRTPLLNLAWTTDDTGLLSRAGTAVFAQTGGELAVDSMKIGRDGSYSLSGGSLAVSGAVVNDGSFSATGGRLHLGGNITNNGRWSVAAAVQTFSGTTEFGAGSNTHLADGATATFAGLVIERTGAQFTGGGTKVFLGGLRVGASPGLVNESGNVQFGGDNTYTAEIGGTAAGTGFDAYRVAGALQFGGQLVLTAWQGFEAQAGQRFDLFDWGTVSGSFSSIDSTGLLLAPNTALDLSQLYVDGSFAVVAVPEPASALLLAAGLGVFAVSARRSRQRTTA